MTRITTRAFYAESRERITLVTSDEAVLVSFDLMVESDLAGDDESEDQATVERWNTLQGDFIADTVRLRISLDYIFGGNGAPFLPPLPEQMEGEITYDLYRLPDEVKLLFAQFVAGLADYTRRQATKKYKPKGDEPDDAT